MECAGQFPENMCMCVCAFKTLHFLVTLVLYRLSMIPPYGSRYTFHETYMENRKTRKTQVDQHLCLQLPTRSTQDTRGESKTCRRNLDTAGRRAPRY